MSGVMRNALAENKGKKQVTNEQLRQEGVNSSKMEGTATDLKKDTNDK